MLSRGKKDGMNRDDIYIYIYILVKECDSFHMSIKDGAREYGLAATI